MTQAPVKPTAREKLTPSVFRPTQLEMMGNDVDLSKFFIALNHKDFNIREAVKDIKVTRTIEGASTVEVDIADHDRKLLRSGLLSHRLTIEIDGLFFVLVSVAKSGGDLTLMFEDREVYILRTYNKPVKQSATTSRAHVTRAQFVLRLLKEVTEFRIKYVIPQLKVVQPIGSSADNADVSSNTVNRAFGIPSGNSLTVKGNPMSAEQRNNANKILDVAASMILPRRLFVMAIMAAIQESSITNLGQPQLGAYNHLSDNPDYNPVGVFQQIKHWGWPASRDVETDAHAFLSKLSAYIQGKPNIAYYAAVEGVQNSGNGQAYAQWRTEAERIVTGYGMIDGSSAAANLQWDVPANSTGDYEFYRGIPPTSTVQKKKGRGGWGKESTWDCYQRLASEVQWRAFFVSGTFYFISDADLFKSKPIATLDEDSRGIDSIDGEYDEGKKSASLEVTIETGRWTAPPGSVIQIQNMGPWNGRWLVNEMSRSLFNRTATITLKKPLPVLPEPSGSNVSANGTGTGSQTWGGADAPTNDHPGTGSANALSEQSSQKLAIDLMLQLGRGWRDDNGRGAAQIQKVAAGQELTGVRGTVPLDPGPLRVVLWLIDQGYTIGTYAWCEDHHDDGPNGHAGGKAVDISSINGQAINQHTDKVRQLVLEVDRLINGSTGLMHPRQLISGGYGYQRDFEISSLSIPAADQFYGASTMQDHTNHIHVGY